eukprot:15431736-Alexandrium_andersonii.AAC.1
MASAESRYVTRPMVAAVAWLALVPGTCIARPPDGRPSRQSWKGSCREAMAERPRESSMARKAS